MSGELFDDCLWSKERRQGRSWKCDIRGLQWILSHHMGVMLGGMVIYVVQAQSRVHCASVLRGPDLPGAIHPGGLC